MAACVRVSARVAIGGRVAAQGRTARLAGAQMHPTAANFDTLFTHEFPGMQDLLHCSEMLARSVLSHAQPAF